MIKFEINWNRKLVLRGEGTAAAVSETVRSFVHGNFVRIDPKFMRGEIPTLAQLLSLQLEPFSGAYDDGTGRASWSMCRKD